MNVSERRKYLDELNLSPGLRAELEKFLAFETEAEDFMSAAAESVTKDFFEPSEAGENRLVGQQIGIYKTERELGFGGMGAVYLAARSDGKFEQKVAIKMLKREFNVEKIRQTFKREKEILAKLSHPLIARLLDAGTTDGGIPYLVMEYVEGLPIDKFCDRENLSLKERLKLFNKVCEAVSFAHRNLIIHRDLKPSNILVNEKGEPKLLDFGISKLLDAEETTSVTAFGAMTPEYASPEQIRGETISTATDIYSLGVVLYKIMTNSNPYDLKGKTNGEVLKTINDTEPLASYENQKANGKRQKAKPEIENPKSKIQNPKSLRGDLDNIILKALRKEPERRYETVEQFAADIWRFIDGLPVLARRATLFYRASKFFNRNKISVVAGALIFLSLLTGIAVAVRQARVAREQALIASESERKSVIETENAKREEAKSEKISNFMMKFLAYANPNWYAEGAKFKGETKVIEAMNELSGQIDTEFAGQHDIQAELHHKFAEVYSSIGNAEKNRFHAVRALELRRQFYGTRHELVAKDMFYFYISLGIDAPQNAGLLAEAIQMMRETNPNNLNFPYMLEDYAANLSLPKTREVHELYRTAVIPPTDENKYQIAERYLREALLIFRVHYKDNYAIFMNECVLAYALAKQENRKDFDEHFGICKQGEEKLKDTDLSKAMRKHVELVEQALAEKKQSELVFND